MNAMRSGILLVLVFGLLSPAFGDVCDRTSEVVTEIENQARQPCDTVGASELARFNDFYIYGKRIFSLQAVDLAGMTSLEYLDMSANLLIGIPSQIFRSNSDLSEINLSGNQLRSLPKGLFQGLKKLEYLELGQNKLTTLPVGIFQGLDRLSDLDLSSNQFTTLPKGTFSGLSSLEYLNLSGNNFSAEDQAQIRSEVSSDCSVVF